MRAKLVSPDCWPPKWEIPLERFPVVIGRSSAAEIQPLAPDVSPQHCEIDEWDGKLYVRDLGSGSGTFVNDRPVSHSALLPGDKLTVSRSAYIVTYEWTATPRSDSSPLPKSYGYQGSACNDNEPVVTFLGLMELLESQRGLYRRHYNHDPIPDDPMFPDPPHPEHLEHLVVQELRMAGVDPAVIYAFEKTGILVTEFNVDVLPDIDMAAWSDAIADYDIRANKGRNELDDSW